MVDAVHVGRDQDPAQPAVDTYGQPDIAVIEHRRGVEQDFKNHHPQRRCAEHHHRAQLDDHRQQYLDRMEADPRRHVDVEVGMVHAMQPPQQGDGVEQHVLGVDDQVEQDDGNEDRQPIRDRDHVQHSPAIGFGDQREPDRRSREQDSHQHGVDHHHPDIARPAPPPADRRLAARRKQLPRHEQRQHGGEDAKPDQWLGSEAAVRGVEASHEGRIAHRAPACRNFFQRARRTVHRRSDGGEANGEFQEPKRTR